MSDFKLSWNAELGLCRQEGPGHTVPVSKLDSVNNGVFTATRMGLLAQRGELETESALVSLRSLRAMQVTEPVERQGCLRWYWEEEQPVDTNASFFIGMALMLLYLAEKEKLDEQVRAAIREIVEDLAVWFDHELDAAHPMYPNKCLGDLVCNWLATEVLDLEPSGKLVRTTLEWCAYWRREHWGWGEHLSDGYSMVLLNELSAALLFCSKLPDDVRREFKGHFDELLEINDVYHGGPRVPTIRSYAFTETPKIYEFRSFVKPTVADVDLMNTSVVEDQGKLFGSWFHQAGWWRIAPKLKPAKPWIEVPCRDDAVARAVVLPFIRIGAMSHYPIMEDVDHQDWGLSWQTFPAALWRPSGDWGFWRWTTCSEDCVRAHPAMSKASAYLGNALSTKIDPPPLPRMTSTLTPEGKMTMERTLPVPAVVGWDEVSDSFVIIDNDAEIIAEGSQLSLIWTDCAVVVKWLGDGTPKWKPEASGGNWVVRYDRVALEGIESLTHCWELTLQENQ